MRPATDVVQSGNGAKHAARLLNARWILACNGRAVAWHEYRSVSQDPRDVTCKLCPAHAEWPQPARALTISITIPNGMETDRTRELLRLGSAKTRAEAFAMQLQEHLGGWPGISVTYPTEDR